MTEIFSFIEKVAEYTVVPIGRQAGYVIFYKGNFKKLEHGVKELEGKRERMNNQVQEATRNGKVIFRHVSDWLERVDAVIEDAKRLKEDPRHAKKVGCSKVSFPNLLSRHQLSRNATKMTINVAEEVGKPDFVEVGHLPHLDMVAPDATSLKLETRESFKEEIMKALRDPNARNIGVYGLGGMGKTYLVEEISQIAKKDKLFDTVVMAKVSQTPDTEKIQQEIADMLGLEFKEKSVVGRAKRLRQRIMNEKNVLVILDDIWTRLDLKEVGIPRENEHNDCKLLMTSRNKEVLFDMETQKDFTFRLEVLREEETRSLFQFMTPNVFEDINYKNVATQVAKKCAGFPLLIVTIAGALRDRDVYAWNDMLRQLENNDHPDMKKVIEWSCDLLVSNDMKELFLLFATLNFPDEEEYFLRVAVGLGIFKQINIVDDARNRFYKIVESLKASCLLLEGNTSSPIQMHDVVRDVAISIASKVHHVFVMKKRDELKIWPAKEYLKNCSHIIIQSCHIHELPQRLDCPNLKLFHLYGDTNCSLKVPDTIFMGMESLKVLDLTCLNLLSLPTSFRSLTNLQTLFLDRCLLENMDAIGAIKNLEILSIRWSPMVELPTEFGELTCLRILDLSNDGNVSIPPNILSRLIQLEELYMGNTIIKWEIDNSTRQNENASLVELQQLSKLRALELQIHDVGILPRNFKLMFEKLKRYKIVIGDVWESSDIANETLNTLKLKLSTNINSECEIKAVTKVVKKLYLDEVDGISNVLYQLNGEGFPLLTHLHIQNNAKMKYIIETSEINQVQASFPNLERLVLHNLKNLKQICRGQLAVNSFSKLSVIKVQNCIQLKYLLSYPMVKELFQLSEIDVCQCNSMKKIMVEDNDSSVVEKVEFVSLHSLTLQHLETLDNFSSCELISSITEQTYQRCETYVPTPFFGAQVGFPNLHTLKLSSLNLNKIWDDNKHSVYKLTNLIVENCGGLKYLFSSIMVGSFMNLKHLEIRKCHLMDEIIATEERNNGTSESKEFQFSKLETIILEDMENLKTIWHRQFGTLKTLKVKNCEKIVVVFPSSMQKTYNNLEVLEVKDCDLVDVIFELTTNEEINREDATQLKVITLEGLPKLKNIWNKDPQGILSFRNLEKIFVQNCGSLEYLFPLSVATHCSNLNELCIKWCWNMMEIVAEQKESMCITPIFEFNQLKTLRLWALPKLKGFYAGNNTLACPSLRELDILRCGNLNLFKITSTPSLGRFQNGKLPVSVAQPLFIVEEVIPNLEMLAMGPRDAKVILQVDNLGALLTNLTFIKFSGFMNEKAAFPHWFLQNVPSLEELTVEWSSFMNIFQDQRLLSQKICTRLKWLTLNQLPNLQNICEEGCQIDSVIEVLEYLDVTGCPSLRNLLPSLATFNHMKFLEIINCNGLKYLFEPYTAKSLVNLIQIKVSDCTSLEEIMTGKEDVGITFVTLQILKLENLPRLNKFCSSECCLNFPLLEEVVVKECTRMKAFSDGHISTPNLRNVKTAENDEERHWKGDLNATISNMFDEKVTFYRLKHLTLSEYPELKDLWYGQHHHNMFCNLKSLVVHQCDFLSNVLFPSNLWQVLHGLEELEVKECDSLETVFDVKGIQSKEILVKQHSQLRKLTLFCLPKLKHIWNEDPHKIMSFGNLSIVDVSECQSLSNLFSLSLCQDLGHLEKLEIRSCGVEEIVAMEEGSMKNNFNFPHLTTLTLYYLTNLKSFYPGKHTLECPSLRILNVYHCDGLRMFSFNHLDFQEPGQKDEIQEALFSIQKASPNLEQLALVSKDALRILNDYCQENLFNKVEFLRLQCFDETPTTYLNCFHTIFPNLATLQVRRSSFDTLFLKEGRGHVSTHFSNQIKKLWLYELEQLRYIWQEDFPQKVLDLLEELRVINCPNLISMVPSSTSLKNLTILVVENCKGLNYLIKSSTAKSLVQLNALIITNCEMILDVIKMDEEKAEEDIIFEKLEYMELSSLSSFRSFYYGKHTLVFPSLLRLVVKGCPQMEIFASGVTVAPFLSGIEVENGKKRWKDDLNSSIAELFKEQVVVDFNGTEGKGESVKSETESITLKVLPPSEMNLKKEQNEEMKQEINMNKTSTSTKAQCMDENSAIEHDDDNTLQACKMETTVDKYDSKIWPEFIVKAFINVMIEEVNKGNMSNGVFHSRTWTVMVQKLNSITNRSFSIEQIKQKMNRLRTMHREFSLLLQQTGFGWDAETNTVIASHEVWQNYIRAHPIVAPFQKKGCEHYKLLGIIFNKSTRTGELHHSSTQDPPNTDEENELESQYLNIGVHVDVDNDTSDDDIQEVESIICSGKRQIEVKDNKYKKEKNKMQMGETLLEWVEESKAKPQASLARAERYRGRSIEATSSDRSHDYSMAKCVRILDEIEEVSDDVYLKALDKLQEPTWRETFVTIPSARRKAWLLRLKE